MSAFTTTHARPDRTAQSTGLWRSLRRIGPYFRPVRTRFILGVLAGLSATLLALLIPQVLRLLVNGPLAAGDRGQVSISALIVLGLGVAEAALWYSRRLLVMSPMLGVEYDMRTDLYRRLQDLPVVFHDRWASGQLLSRSSTDLGTIRRWLTFGLLLLIVNVVAVVIGVGLLIAMNPLLGCVFLIINAPIWFIGYRFETRYQDVSRRSQDQAGTLATVVEQSVHGIRVLKAFGRGPYALRRFSERAQQLRSVELEKARAESSIWMWLIMIPQLAFAVCLGLGLWLAASGTMNTGDVVAFFTTAAYLSWPIQSLGFLFAETIEARTAIDRVYEVFEAANTVTDPAHPVVPTTSTGAVTFSDVHFRYPDAAVDAPDLLDGVNLEIRAGETMALVGVTGSGKSAITELLPRLYDVTGGSLSVDGVDVRAMTRSELRRRVAMAFEEPTLFSESVRENVLLGNPDAGDDVLTEALRIAQADFVATLPDGVDTVIGEEGHSLSGGQRQRLALARAVAAAPDVLVLDDPLSALDVKTESAVENALRSVLERTTALIVAHRPSTVAMADRVALLESGRITAVGTHSELLAENAQYRFVISSLDEDEANDGDSEAAR